MALAEGTDLLLDHADAWAALAAVRFDAGDESRGSAAQAEADRLYAAKGSTLHVSPGERTPALNDDRPSRRASGLHQPAENLATRNARDMVRAWMTHDWETVRSLCTEDARWEDRRRDLGSLQVGRSARVEGLRAATEVGERSRLAAGAESLGSNGYEIFEVVAQRGDRLTVLREGLLGNYEVEVLLLAEVDDAGRQRLAITFDPDDLPAALAELEACYQAGEGAAGHPSETMATRRAREYLARWAESGPEAVRALLSEDLRWEDHRQGLTAAEDGIDAHLAGLAVITELLQGQRTVIHEVVAARGEHLVLTRGGITGPYEVESLSLWQFDASGRLCCSALFDPDDLPTALAELDARYPEDTATPARLG